MISLDDFIAHERKRPWDWRRNCVIWLSDYIFARTGKDPALRFRLACRTEKDCRDIIAREGGFMPLVGYLMDEAGFERSSGKRGDVAIVNAPLNRDELTQMPVVGAIGAICVGSRGVDQYPLSVVRSLTGLRWARLPVVTAWAIR